MEIYLLTVIVCLVIIVIAEAVKIHLCRKSAGEILSAIKEHMNEDTNTLIDISSHDKYICELAKGINNELRMLRNERRRYEQSDTELKEAVTNIVHDLRTPLTAIYGYLDLLDGEEKSSNVTRYTEMIKNRTEMLKQLTEELFRYSVITSIQEVSQKKVNINAVLEESLASFYGAMTGRKIEPVISLSQEKIERMLDESALSRIFSNIISNALKYSDGDFAVTMSDTAVITFSNTSKSLTTVTVGRLFDRFYTVESGRNSTGLGLSIAKLLTERMGGTINARFHDNRLDIIVEFP